jgi:nucleoid-associated protein EbfC
MMRGQIANLMQQAQRMQETMKQAQDELATIEVTGQAGGGAVTVRMSARMDVRRVAIDRELMASDPEMVEDLVVAAINDAVNKAQEASQARMAEVTAGLPLPPGMKLPGLF